MALPLKELVTGYMESEGYRILESEGGVVVADRLLFGAERDTRIAWVFEKTKGGSSLESELRASVSKMALRYPGAKASVVSESLAGFGRELQRGLRDQGIKLLTPVLFFDTPFKQEVAPGRAARSIVDDIFANSEEELASRIAQPYSVDGDNHGFADRRDLLDRLVEEIGSESGPSVRVVVGRAGSGKSVLFSALANRLHGEFMEAKRRRAQRPRPIPFLPQHLREAYAIRIEVLLDSFLRSDIASPVGSEAFKWLLVHGFHTWLLDGLDELYAGDPRFFEHLVDLITQQHSSAQITVFCRDSLLTTSDAFQEFSDLCAGSDLLRVYRLGGWDLEAKREYAWLRLEDRKRRRGEPDTEPVRDFLAELSSNSGLESVTELPFYCSLLVDEFRLGRLREYRDEVELLDYVVDEMIDREVGKGLLDLSLFEKGGLQDWLEQIAVSYVESRYSDVDSEEALDYGRYVIRDGVEEADQQHILTGLLQFPLFRQGQARGTFAFAHDLIADALAARGYLRALRRDAISVGHRLSAVDLEEPNLLTLMSRRLGEVEAKSLVQVLEDGSLHGAPFAVLLTLLLLARPDRDLVVNSRVKFEGQHLSGVAFSGRNLSGVSFRNSDLSYACFSNCDLSDALFEGAFMRRTKFSPPIDLSRAHFGGIGRVESIIDGTRLIDDPARIRKWLSRSVGQLEPNGEPCPTALQVRFLFSKFITPLGRPKRDDLRRDGLLAGKRFGGAALAEECLDESCKFGYLVGPDQRGRFRRSSGDGYSEMVSLVRDSKISDGIGRLIGHLCRVSGCMHRII